MVPVFFSPVDLVVDAYASRRCRVFIVNDHIRVAARAGLLIELMQGNPAITIARSDESFRRHPLGIATDSSLDHGLKTYVQPDHEFPEPTQIGAKKKTAIDDDDRVFRNLNRWKIDR